MRKRRVIPHLYLRVLVQWGRLEFLKSEGC